MSEFDIDLIIKTCRRDTRCIGGIERLALCDEVERLRRLVGRQRQYIVNHWQGSVTKLNGVLESLESEVSDE